MATLVWVLAAAGVPGQAFTSPLGFDEREGNTFFVYWSTIRRLQVVDNTCHKVHLAGIKQAAFRRDRLNGGAASYARRLQVELRMGLLPWGSAQSVFERNFRPGTRVVVYSAKVTDMPDWRGVPNPPPGPWDLVLPFDAGFDHPGGEALVWDVSVQSASGSGIMDGQYRPSSNSSDQRTPFGLGCRRIGAFNSAWLDMTLHNHGTAGVGIRPVVSYGMGRAPVYIALDAVRTSMRVPGLCTELQVVPNLLFTSASLRTDDTGFMVFPEIILPLAPVLVGQALYAQAFMPDSSQPGLPWLVTQGITAKVPALPPPGIECLHLWERRSAQEAEYIEVGGAPLAQFSN
ncbi:MAG: hypothetical protein IT458_10120 [Planctomycetes bacterium]|nr:hypothetical protein [Planctomycetota bacterium]